MIPILQSTDDINWIDGKWYAYDERTVKSSNKSIRIESY